MVSMFVLHTLPYVDRHLQLGAVLALRAFIAQIIACMQHPRMGRVWWCTFIS